MSEDKRPDPKPRQYPRLWQAYLHWEELMEMRKRHMLRLSSIDKEKSNMEAWFEEQILEDLESAKLLDNAIKAMAAAGQEAGLIWDWVTGHKGIGDSLAAQLIAQVDDIGKFATVAKLWRFSGYAVIGGKAEPKANRMHYNGTLKGVAWKIGDQFIRHHTPGYREIYDDEKARQKQLNPNSLCTKCEGVAIKNGQSWQCPEHKDARVDFTPRHLDLRARRKMIKELLKEFWKAWRRFDGLPLGEPYSEAG